MKKNIIVTLIVNYVALIIYIFQVILNNMSFHAFMNRFLILFISLNTVLFIFFKCILKNINKSESKVNIDVTIPPVESELKDILNEMNEDEKDIEEEFEELNFKDLRN